MDQRAPREDILTTPPKSARVALSVLALCFALSVLGRGLGESFTVFLKPIAENFGWDRAEVVSVYSLTALAAGLSAPLIGRLFDPYIVDAVTAAPIVPVLRSRLVWRGSGTFEIYVAEELQQEATPLAKRFIVICAECWRATHVSAKCLVSRLPSDNNSLGLHWRSRRRVR